MAVVVFMGLSMEDTMQTRIMAAVRGMCAADLPVGVTDDAATKHVLLILFTDILCRWEASQAGPDPTQAGATAGDQARAVQSAAATQARSDAAAIQPVP